MNNDQKRYYRRQLEQERHRRNGKRQQVLDIVLANFVRHPRAAVGLNIVYELVAQTLGVANSVSFKREVSEILQTELKVHKVSGRNSGRIDRNGFKGIGTKEYVAWRLEQDAIVKAAAAERWRQCGLNANHSEIGKLGGRGNTRAKRLAKEAAEREAKEKGET